MFLWFRLSPWREVRKVDRGVSNRVFSCHLGSSLPICLFFVLFREFSRVLWDHPDFLGFPQFVLFLFLDLPKWLQGKFLNGSAISTFLEKSGRSLEKKPPAHLPSETWMQQSFSWRICCDDFLCCRPKIACKSAITETWEGHLTLGLQRRDG